ncbi:MAG TPA: chaperone modulator CbpM [Nitrosomonas sp.]|jgi:chaperone modulatory protein CbpM|nr:MerR family transcriptional regulator [Nitrosomonas sp.]MBP6366150.1 MerR family transcriptional regulator [Nitrosomonas sp.]MBP9870931.1 MerR family transcriptional regulator [Nitrosomonas sp.]HQV87577.1 chaperone modulator CbpM [Nitrosomonas sp.]HRB97094.1 chaperone modulator CbpM [Nitrosomonas sp.]
MTHEIDAIVIDDAMLSLDELARSCQVTREWVIERVRCGLLLNEESIHADPATWIFDSRCFIRVKRIIAVEKDFECNPELAGLVIDLIEEIEFLRARLPATQFNKD